MLVSKLAAKFNKNPEVKEKIKNFERDIHKELCPKCQKKFPLFQHRLQHTVAEGRVFCKSCNNLIAEKWAKLFKEAVETTTHNNTGGD